MMTSKESTLPSSETRYKILSFLENFKIPKQRFVLIYDAKLEKKIKSLKSVAFLSLKVKGGESIKSYEFMGTLLKKIARTERISQKPVELFILVGGGSVGDLGAFMAGIYKRGLPLIHLPTTYLSALDSAFGGKAGVNLEGVKNQLGIIYPAQEVLIIKEFFSEDKKLLIEAYGELLKVALLGGGLWEDIKSIEDVRGKDFWKFLPKAIELKLNVVRADPFEKKGLRQALNLGHTLGHIFEAEFKLPHGLAVALGLRWELAFMCHEKILKQEDYSLFLSFWEKLFYDFLAKRNNVSMSEKRFLELITKDKKITSNAKGILSVRMPLLSRIGAYEIKEVSLARILLFLKKESFFKK